MSFGQFQIRRDTAANWTSANPVLASGEFGMETDTLAIKLGDGSTAWNSLGYYSTKVRVGSGVPAGSLGVVGDVYIRSATGDLYQKTAVSTWTLQGSLVGPQGVQGNPGVITTLNTTAPLAGGGSAATLTLSVAAATTSAPGSQSAADKARQNNLANYQVTLLDFGGVADGSTNNDTAFTNAFAALPSGGVVLLGPGQYNHASNIAIPNNIEVRGAGANATILRWNATTGDQVTVSGYGAGITNLTVQGPGATTVSSKTAGYGVNLTGTETYAESLEFTWQYNCIGVNGPLSEIDDIFCRYYANSASIVNQNSDHRINRLFTDNDTAHLPTGAGIDVQVTASLLLSNCNIIHANNCLNLSPATGVTVPSVKGLNCFFDSSAVGLRVAGAGSVFRSEFTNCWFSSMSTAGIQLTPAVGGQADGITFVNCDIYNNIGGTTTGVDTNAQTGKWKMVGSSVAGWTTGINLVAGANHFPTIIANTIGAVSAFAANTTGIVIGAGAYKGFVIGTNDVVNNTTPITIGAFTATTYTQCRIFGNAGINPRGSVTTPGVPASTTAVTNQTAFPVLVMLKAGTTAPTVLTVNGVAAGGAVASQMIPIPLEPGGTIAMTYTVAPTWTWIGQ